TLVNVARAGLNYLHTTRVSPEANTLTDIPSTFGIQGIPQSHENGGLPAFGINGLSTLGSNAFLPSDEVSSTIQLTDDLTKIYASNSSLTDNGKNYYGLYLNDDWKLSPRLTMNLGLRWDFFGLVYDHHGKQANFVPGGAPLGGPVYLLPGGTNPANLSSSFTT